MLRHDRRTHRVRWRLDRSVVSQFEISKLNHREMPQSSFDVWAHIVRAWILSERGASPIRRVASRQSKRRLYIGDMARLWRAIKRRSDASRDFQISRHGRALRFGRSILPKSFWPALVQAGTLFLYGSRFFAGWSVPIVSTMRPHKGARNFKLRHYPRSALFKLAPLPTWPLIFVLRQMHPPRLFPSAA